MLKPCLDCGALTKGRRCVEHQRQHEARRTAPRHGLYGRAHRARAKAQLEEYPQCEGCGATGDLVADHLLPGDPASPLRTLCRSCNSRRANAMRWGGGRVSNANR